MNLPLPPVRGEYRQNYSLAKVTWFRVGGFAEVLFLPADTDDLIFFLKNKPENIPITIIGVGSNLLVRDGGIKGVVIRLGRGFSDIAINGNEVNVGAATLNFNLAKACQQAGISNLEFLSGIPGTVGGSLAMNAGAYGSEIKDILLMAEAIDPHGILHKLSVEDMGYSYRSSKIPANWIFTKAIFKGKNADTALVAEKMAEIAAKREASQPLRTRTGGSTFKNPPEKKAWQLIDEAGCRGLRIGDAQCSEKHCNFLINTGNARADDLETLGEEIRRKVKEKSGVILEWEIKIIGEA